MAKARSANALYQEEYYRRHPEKKHQFRIREAQRLLLREKWKLIPPENVDPATVVPQITKI